MMTKKLRQACEIDSFSLMSRSSGARTSAIDVAAQMNDGSITIRGDDIHLPQA